AGAGAVDPTGPTLAFDTGRLGLLIFFVDPARNAGAEQNATGGAGSTYGEADNFVDSQEMLRGPEWTVELRGDVVIGRQPRGQARPNHEAPQLVMVPSPALEISRVHCEVRVDGNEAVIVDRDSNNGTYVLRAGTEPMRVAPESPVLLHDGDIIDIGEGVRFEVAYGI
ncbi:FHA domain-containing protein, partial [Actinobaculum suis]|uniref:FHA domain-containing protein n=1 Tax=Actinobaculum suis TaxID=1657 RepID=UPI0018CE2E62